MQTSSLAGYKLTRQRKPESQHDKSHTGNPLRIFLGHIQPQTVRVLGLWRTEAVRIRRQTAFQGLGQYQKPKGRGKLTVLDPLFSPHVTQAQARSYMRYPLVVGKGPEGSLNAAPGTRVHGFCIFF